MMIVVFDTNVLISTFLWGGLPAQAFFASTDPDYDIEAIVSDELLEELREVLSRQKFAERLQEKNLSVESITSRYRQLATIVQSDPTIINIFRDPKDDMVLACAVGGGASIVVSSDKDVLSKNNYGDIRFLSVEAFLEELG